MDISVTKEQWDDTREKYGFRLKRLPRLGAVGASEWFLSISEMRYPRLHFFVLIAGERRLIHVHLDLVVHRAKGETREVRDFVESNFGSMGYEFC